MVPCHDEERALPALFAALRRIPPALPGAAVEVVCVNDGSRDGTLDALRREQGSAGLDIVVVDLSRNFGKEAALSAGLAVASGDAVIPLDADLQDPPDLIPRLVALWEEGFEVVLAKRSDRSSDTRLKRWAASAFYRTHNAISEVMVPPNVGDFRLMDRVVVDTINALPESRRLLKGLFAWAGFRSTVVEYVRESRSAGTTKLGFGRLLGLALDGITSFSLSPLRAASLLGTISAAIAMAYGGWILFRTLVFGIEVPGYASIFTAILFLGGIQLICLGIIGEYVGRTYVEAKRRPPYVIRKVYKTAAS